MSDARFVQIHTLHGYSAVLLNRDDAGLAKRLPYGGAMRTRISSQCLKRHWRMEPDGKTERFSDFTSFEPSYRSRQHFDRKIIGELGLNAEHPVVDALKCWFVWSIYSGKADKAPKIDKAGAVKAVDYELQPLLLGGPELDWLRKEFARLHKEADNDVRRAFELGETWATGGLTKEAKKAGVDFRTNMKALRNTTLMPGGLTAALFGRMVTSDPEANIDAPVHVAHAFTVHAEQSESDYFSVVDDLRGVDDDAGADHIGETELTSGLFYGYVVLDVGGLLKNVGGDGDLAAEITRRLIHLIAEISPGAKRGSTAPYGYAATVLVETGDRQPRSLAEAFRKPCAPIHEDAETALGRHLATLDAAYETGEARRFTSLRNDAALASAERLSLPRLADWAAAQVRGRAA